MPASSSRPASPDGRCCSPLPASEYPTTASSSCHDPAVLSHNALHRWSLSTRTIASYVRLEQIGEGTYGQVYRARPVSTRGAGTGESDFVALKKIRLHHPGYWGIPPTVLREIKILKQLSHRNMVKMIEVVSSKGVEHLDWEEDSSKSRELKKKKMTKVSNSTAALVNLATNSNNYASKSHASTPCIDSDYNKYKDNDTNNDSDDNENPDSSTLKQFADLPNEKKKHSSSSSDLDALRESYKGSLFLVLEYVSHDLTGLLDMAYKFTEVQAKSLMQQLLEVLEYMHEKKFVHRDLKSSNLLITSQFRVKLADFGLARCLDDGNPRMIAGDGREKDYPTNEGEFTNKVITLWYRPPELLLGETRYGTAVDIWSAGCILAEIILGRPMFTGKTEMDQLKLIFELIGTPTEKTWEGFNELKLIRTGEVTIDKVRRPKLREKYGAKIQPVSALNLLEKLLELDPKKRITARGALTHRYFRVEPIAPSDPSELGTIDLGDGEDGSGYHEFQTKKRRREAKAVAKQAEDEAKRRGEDVEKQKEAFDKAYREHLKKGAEGDKEKKLLKEKLEKHHKEQEIRDKELQLEMQMFPEQHFEQRQEGLQGMRQQQVQQHDPHPSTHESNPQHPRHQENIQERNFSNERDGQERPRPPQRDRFSHQVHHPLSDDRRHNPADNWQQRTHKPEQHQQPTFDRKTEDSRQPRSHATQQQPPFDRNARENRHLRSHPPHEQPPFWHRSQPQQQPPFDRGGTRGPRANVNYDMPPPDRRIIDGHPRRENIPLPDSRYGRNGHMNRPPDAYNRIEGPQLPFQHGLGRTGDNFRSHRRDAYDERKDSHSNYPNQAPPGGNYDERRREDAQFRSEDRNRHHGWNERERFSASENRSSRDLVRVDTNVGDEPFETKDQNRSESKTRKDTRDRENSMKDEPQENRENPSIESEISLEAAETLMLRDFGSNERHKSREDSRSIRHGRGNHHHREHSEQRHRNGRERSGEGSDRHQDRTESHSKEYRRRHHSSSSSHSHKERTSRDSLDPKENVKEDAEEIPIVDHPALKEPAEVMESVSRDRSLSVSKRGENIDGQTREKRPREHSSHSSSDRNREGECVDRVHSHAHKRGRHEERRLSDGRRERSHDERHRSDRRTEGSGSGYQYPKSIRDQRNQFAENDKQHGPPGRPYDERQRWNVGDHRSARDGDKGRDDSFAPPPDRQYDRFGNPIPPGGFRHHREQDRGNEFGSRGRQERDERR